MAQPAFIDAPFTAAMTEVFALFSTTSLALPSPLSLQWKRICLIKFIL